MSDERKRQRRKAFTTWALAVFCCYVIGFVLLFIVDGYTDYFQHGLRNDVLNVLYWPMIWLRGLGR